MYIARIKIKWKDIYKNDYYKINTWMKCSIFKDKDCLWRIKEDNIIEFVLGYYEDRQQALSDGKNLYFNILYDFHRNEHGFYLGDDSYITQMFHSDRGYTIDEFENNEEWFFVSKKNRSNFLGLHVFEIDNDISDYDKYYSDMNIKMTVIFSKRFYFIDRIANNKDECYYSESNQKVFNIIGLAENVDSKTRLLLLIQATEMMGKNEEKTDEEIELIDYLKTIVEKSNLDGSKKDSLNGYLENGKNISSRKKCKNLIDKYCKKDYDWFNKYSVLNEAYELRSKIVHGEEIEEKEVFDISEKLKFIVLDTLKEWSKDN